MENNGKFDPTKINLDSAQQENRSGRLVVIVAAAVVLTLVSGIIAFAYRSNQRKSTQSVASPVAYYPSPAPTISPQLAVSPYPSKLPASPTAIISQTSSNCAKEGEAFSKVYTDEYPENCCAGLTEIYSGFDTREVVNGICQETDRISGYPVGVCLKIDDGLCSEKENICNSPNDCKK